jgi:hypothetical protein
MMAQPSDVGAKRRRAPPPLISWVHGQEAADCDYELLCYLDMHPHFLSRRADMINRNDGVRRKHLDGATREPLIRTETTD